MPAAIITSAVCAIVIIFAGTWLTRTPDTIAERTGFGRLLVGSILLAGATLLPELTVGVSAALQGWVDLTMGDLVGAARFNLLTLALVDLTHHSSGSLLSRTSSAHALSAMVSMAMCAVAAIGLLTASRGYN